VATQDDDPTIPTANPAPTRASAVRVKDNDSKNYYLPKIVLCLLSDLESKPRLEQMLSGEGIEHEFGERDSRMDQSFVAVASGTNPSSLTQHDLDQIADHSLVLYIVSDAYPKDKAFQAASWFLLVACKLLNADAVAMKCESSGIAHSRRRWIELGENCKHNRPSASDSEDSEPSAGFYTSLFEAYVQYPIASNEDYYSCGMHLLGKADVIIASSLLKNALPESDSLIADLAYLFNAFCLYILAESSECHFVSGNIFHPDLELPSFRVVWEECQGYPEDDLYFNPYGRWRFVI
jgi:hypothetical protein